MSLQSRFLPLRRLALASIFAPFLACALAAQPSSPSDASAETNPFAVVRTAAPTTLSLTLEASINLALAKNRMRPISRYAWEMAEAQYQQAMSGYWPELKLQGGYTLLDDNMTFKYPSMGVSIPAMAIPIGGQSIQLPGGVLGPNPVTIPLPNSTINTPAQKFQVPGQQIDVWGRQTLAGELALAYPLYTGGKVSAIVRQAEAGVEAARVEMRRTDLQILYDVQRMYYAAVMTRRLHKIGQETLERLSATLDLTESLYKGSTTGTVKKTDYLRNKLTVEGVRGMVAWLAANEQMTQAALVNTIGLPWDSRIDPVMQDIPLSLSDPKLTELVGEAYQFNPDWAQLDAGLKAAAAKIDEAKSGDLPKIMLTGSLSRVENSAPSINTPENRNSWSVGIGFQIPLFSGFRTRGEIREAQARLHQMQEQRLLLRDALGIQIRAAVEQLIGAGGQSTWGVQAAATATENRDLNMRAYQAGLLETKDVIESQMTEAFLLAQAQKALFDHAQAEALLDFIVGSDVNDRLKGAGALAQQPSQEKASR